jgi:hypothetical protein
MAVTKIKLSKQTFADADVDFNAKKITNLATPISGSDAVTKDYADGLLAANDAMIYKGVIDCSGNPNYPTADAGHLYKVSVSGKIGGASGQSVTAGNEVLCTHDGTSAGDQATVGIYWNIVGSGGSSGDVNGPGSSTDNAVPRFDGTGGKTLQNSLMTVDDSGAPNIPSGQSYKKNGSAITTADIADSSDARYCTNAEKTVIGNTSGTNSGNETGTSIGAIIQAATAKSTALVDGDKIAIIDSEASNVLKTSLWSVIKSSLKTYFMGLYVCREAPTGTKNGSNTDFTLAYTPVTGTEMVFLNGVLMNAGAGNDYTIATNVITFLTGMIPISTDVILVTYWK